MSRKFGAQLIGFGKILMYRNRVLCRLEPEDVIPYIPKMGSLSNKELRHIFRDRKGNKHNVRVDTETLITVVSKPVCSHCGTEITHFKILQNDTDKYLLAYAIANNDTRRSSWQIFGDFVLETKPGDEVPLTKDHIVPKSRGGSNEFKNYQTMCGPCNWDKGSGKLDSVSNLWYIRWPNAVHPDGPFILPFSTNDESKVRELIRNRWKYRRLPRGFECWPTNGNHLKL